MGQEPLYATPSSEGLPGVPEGALIRLDREVYGLVSGMSGWRSRIDSRLIEEGLYEPCLFSKYAVNEEPAVDGGTIALGAFLGSVLFEVDDHLMGGPGSAHLESMERVQQGRHTQRPERSFKVDMTRFIQERLLQLYCSGDESGQER